MTLSCSANACTEGVGARCSSEQKGVRGAADDEVREITNPLRKNTDAVVRKSQPLQGAESETAL